MGVRVIVEVLDMYPPQPSTFYEVDDYLREVGWKLISRYDRGLDLRWSLQDAPVKLQARPGARSPGLVETYRHLDHTPPLIASARVIFFPRYPRFSATAPASRHFLRLQNEFHE